ncbi:hypothetical protein HO133_006131 [Letharia lupina]|uniref:Uncharacterized protein n=1 Tax=Letharia lupina TaxID=560253 RepID=A0A8H6C774_9LECA|nr:uncharacterized protein HO133_006131 [Letharia lupina]KAF6218172.1 hypothetical protein HO133_006131 [Letharia lupina]
MTPIDNSTFRPQAFWLQKATRWFFLITPVAIPQDNKIDGYVGYMPTPPTSDWLTTTYCYCSQPHHLQAPAFDEGSFFQWEYYNYHQNATFVMHRRCQANHAETRTCVNSKHVHCDLAVDGDCEGNMLCTSWPRARALRKRDAGGVKKDHWCMSLDDRGFLGVSDSIIWNTQERGLTRKGGQGRRGTSDGEVEAVCGGLCRGRVGMPMLEGDRNARSHQEVFEDLDDMCDSCRR